MSADDSTLAFSLVSHTNVGKTTLARTLLNRDVGEVLDQAHVTDQSRCSLLVEAPDGARLELWDTPGFGDSVRMLRALRAEESPIEWLGAQEYDPHTERPMFCGREAVLNVRRHADLVLYLVNAVEHPDEAGYVAPEMELLSWLGKPVIVLLNQTGPPRPAGERGAEEELWRKALARHAIVRDVLELDAFTRCWVEEGTLLDRACKVLPAERAALCERLLAAWRVQRGALFLGSMELLAGELARTAADRERIVEGAFGQDKKQAMANLARRLEEHTARTLARVIALHGLEGRSAVKLSTAVTDFEAPGLRLSPRKAGIVGGVVSGLTGGLAADVLSGGLSLGGGMILGALAGGFGAAGLARAHKIVRGGGSPQVVWSDRMLERSTAEFLLRYLAIAHFGRGRGAWRERQHPAFWLRAVEDALAGSRAELGSLWKQARKLEDPGEPTELRVRLETILGGAAREVLGRFYPEAESFLGVRG